MEAQMQRQPVCYFLLHITSVVFFPIVLLLTLFLLNPPLQVANRAPRKQSLGPLSDISQQEPLRSAVPPGLTGDIFKDTELVEAKVRDLCRRVNLGEPEKEKLRLALMTKGLDAVTVDMSSGAVRVGGGGRGHALSSVISARRSSRPMLTRVCSSITSRLLTWSNPRRHSHATNVRKCCRPPLPSSTTPALIGSSVMNATNCSCRRALSYSTKPWPMGQVKRTERQ